MNRKLLLQMLPPEPASREAVEMIRADRLKREDRKELNSYYWGPNRHQCVYVWDTVTYFEYGIQAVIEAEVCDHLLRLSIYSRYALHRGDLQPEVVVYIDKRKKRWRNYFPQTGKWTEAMIDRVSDVKTDRVTNRYRFVMYDKIACTGTQKAIGYLESDIEMEPKDTAYDAVLRWQRWIREERNERKKEVQADKWNKAMELIPPIPDDFEDWCFRYGMRRHNFLLRQIIPKYDQRRTWIGKYRYICTYCGTEWESNDPGVHNAECECPFCDTKLVLKYWGRQKVLRREEYTGIIQRYGDGFVLRRFYVLTTRRKETDYVPVKAILETRRMIMDKHLNPLACYEHDDRQGSVAPCWNPKLVTDGYRYPPTPRIKCFECAVMYTANIREVMSGKNKWLAKLGEKGSLFLPGEGEEIYPVETLKRMKEHAFLEYVERAGLIKLARQIFRYGKTEELNTSAGRMTDLLNVTGNSIARMKRGNIGYYGLNALRYAEQHDEKLGDEALKLIDDKEINIQPLQLGRTDLTLQKAVLYINKMAMRSKRTFAQMTSRYRDYLDLAEERGMDLHDDIVRRSPKVDELHDRWSEEKQAAKDAKREKDVDRKYKRIAQDLSINREHFCYEAGGFCIVVPEKASDLVREGRLLHHCVGASDRYMKRMISRESFILFLRRQSRQESPYYTLECTWEGKILQAYSEFDRRPDYNEVIGPWLNRFTKALKKKVEKEKRQQLLQEAI